jgi:tetratricopeptide (TPR) repeat protein
MRLIQHLRNLVYIPEETEEDEEEYEPPSRTENRSGGLANLFKDLVFNVDDHEDFEYTKADHILICYYVLGRITHEKGLFDLSPVYYEAVLTQTSPSFLIPKRIVSDRIHFLRALCRLGLGATYELSGQFKRAYESYTKALRMFEQAHDGYIDKFPGDSNLSYVYKAHCLIGLGNLLLIEQKFERADKHYRDALLLFDRYLPVGHPDQSRTRQKMANIVQIYRCKPDMALEDYEDCLENYLRALPSDHVDIARVYVDMACSYEQLPNELVKALEYARKAADIFEKALPKEHTDNVTIYMIIKRIQRKLCLEK